MRLIDEFLIVFMVQRKKRYQAEIHKQHLLIDTLTVVHCSSFFGI